MGEGGASQPPSEMNAPSGLKRIFSLKRCSRIYNTVIVFDEDENGERKKQKV